RPVRERGIELVQEILGVVEPSPVSRQESLTQETYGKSRFSGAGIADEHDVLLPLYEGQSRELIDLGLAHARLFVEGEGFQRPVPGYLRPLEPVEEALIPAVDLFLEKKAVDDLRGRDSLPFRPLDLLIEGARHPLEAQLRKQFVELLVHGSSSLKNSPATWERIICSIRGRS